MHYPNHQIRSYCLYLGSITLDGEDYDLGVYERSNGTVSHAIVYGPEDHEYISGQFIFEGEPWRVRKVNKLAYENYLRGKQK